jgi:hypothetical protein
MFVGSQSGGIEIAARRRVVVRERAISDFYLKFQRSKLSQHKLHIQMLGLPTHSVRRHR